MYSDKTKTGISSDSRFVKKRKITKRKQWGRHISLRTIPGISLKC